MKGGLDSILGDKDEEDEDRVPMTIEGPTNFSHDAHLGISNKGIEVRRKLLATHARALAACVREA